jgi:DNA replication protein DnaC
MRFSTPTDWKSEKWWQNRSPEERMYHMHVPKRVQQQTVTTKLPTVTKRWIDDYTVGDNLIIHGRPGSGKTTLAVDVATQLVMTHAVSARYVDADDYVEMTKESFEHGGELPEMYSTPHLLKYVKGVFDIVILDNLGQERRTDFSSHIVAGLIKKRFDQMKTTIIVSTLNVMDVNRRYEQFTSPALSAYTVVSL